MKFTKILSVSLVSAIAVLGLGFGGQKASADAVVNKGTATTPAQVTITDSTGPIDPNDPTQTGLTLEQVPAEYDFTTNVRNKAYSINGTLTDQSVVVFNDYVEQDWSVKATVLNNIITANDSAKTTFDVTNFTIGDTLVSGTGADGIVFSSGAEKTEDNNTGLLSKEISTASIGFTDTNNVLKVGNVLSGTISYQLYNTATAE